MKREKLINTVIIIAALSGSMYSFSQYMLAEAQASKLVGNVVENYFNFDFVNLLNKQAVGLPLTEYEKERMDNNAEKWLENPNVRRNIEIFEDANKKDGNDASRQYIAAIDEIKKTHQLRPNQENARFALAMQKTMYLNSMMDDASFNAARARGEFYLAFVSIFSIFAAGFVGFSLARRNN